MGKWWGVMLEEYLPALVHVVVGIGFAVVALLTNFLLGRAGARSKAKDTPYECGMLPAIEEQPRFSVKFYLVAMLFILFDIEVVFMYPWAVVFREYLEREGVLIFWSMMGFIGILLVAFLYALRKGAMEWSR
ncbi:MAG: NADH-quinone oxidoreductase subunit A [Chthoniobacterales bacterium]|nr:NADH-quinone oxidoreductase subunit A [Chthoniobacterales bacterium]